MAEGTKDTKSSNQMWGGRFASGPSAIMEEINASIGFDKKLYAQDIRGSKAHATMLAHQGIISAEDKDKILHGLDTILSEIESGQFVFSRKLEDIHMNVEARLADLIGSAAGRLHTARSRNDQVALDFRLYVRDTVDHLDAQLKELQLALASKGFTGAELEEAVKEAMFLAFDEGHQLNKGDILKAIQATSPLSFTMAEMIQDTRAWAKGRAVPASSAEPELLDTSNIKKPRLKQEGENPFVRK